MPLVATSIVLPSPCSVKVINSGPEPCWPMVIVKALPLKAMS